MKFSKKPAVIEAAQWFKNGDHPEDGVGEGQVGRFYRRPDVPGTQPHHADCKYTMDEHGWIDTLEDGHMVCPGDWIITGVKGERYPCKPDIFEMTYDALEPRPVRRGCCDLAHRGHREGCPGAEGSTTEEDA